MACNNLVALMECALKLGEAAHIDRATMWQSLKPLIDATVENIDKQGTKAALTGPVARGDSATVSAHIAAISESKALVSTQLECYQALGEQALDLTAVSARNEALASLLSNIK